LTNGRRFVVSADDQPNTFLNEEIGPFGLYWRRVDTPFMPGHVWLAVSRDERWLVVGGAHEFTACYAILPEKLPPCPGIFQGIDHSAFEEDTRVRTEQISKLTGIRP
jgi:hypothetical protein